MNESWLDDIEARVREAAAAARKVRAENAALRRRLAELEKRQHLAEPAGGEARHEAWSQERQEIRQRLEDLVAHLENLVENSEEEP